MSITTNSPATTTQTPLQSATGNVQSNWLLAVTLSPAAVAGAISAEQSFTVPGLLAGDFVSVSKPTLQAGLGIAGSRAAANTLYITFINSTASTSITPTASEVYSVFIARPIAQEVVNGLPSSLPLP